eukprot:747468-Hanusia_phi.AAC.5
MDFSDFSEADLRHLHGRRSGKPGRGGGRACVTARWRRGRLDSEPALASMQSTDPCVLPAG